jgi:predicted transcriptional regulator
MGEDMQAPDAPGDLDQLIAALATLRYMPPLEQMKRIPDLINETRTTLTAQRATALSAAESGGMKRAEIARQLGISRQQITKIAEGPKNAKESQNGTQGQ